MSRKNTTNNKGTSQDDLNKDNKGTSQDDLNKEMNRQRDRLRDSVYNTAQRMHEMFKSTSRTGASTEFLEKLLAAGRGMGRGGVQGQNPSSGTQSSQAGPVVVRRPRVPIDSTPLTYPARMPMYEFPDSPPDSPTDSTPNPTPNPTTSTLDPNTFVFSSRPTPTAPPGPTPTAPITSTSTSTYSRPFSYDDKSKDFTPQAQARTSTPRHTSSYSQDLMAKAKANAEEIMADMKKKKLFLDKENEKLKHEMNIDTEVAKVFQDVGTNTEVVLQDMETNTEVKVFHHMNTNTEVIVSQNMEMNVEILPREDDTEINREVMNRELSLSVAPRPSYNLTSDFQRRPREKKLTRVVKKIENLSKMRVRVRKILFRKRKQ